MNYCAFMNEGKKKETRWNASPDLHNQVKKGINKSLFQFSKRKLSLMFDLKPSGYFPSTADCKKSNFISGGFHE